MGQDMGHMDQVMVLAIVLAMDQDMDPVSVPVQSQQEATTVQMAAVQQLSQAQQHPTEELQEVHSALPAALHTPLYTHPHGHPHTHITSTATPTSMQLLALLAM